MKKALKILALIVAIGLIITVCFFANALMGNPISHLFAKNAAENYLEEHFADTDYRIEKVAYNFKAPNYYAKVRSDSSIDTQFTIYVDMLGKVTYNTYEDVLNRSTTARRLEQEYRELTDRIFDDPAFPYSADIAYGTLEIYPEEYLSDPAITDIPAYAIGQESLVLDKKYNIRELGSQAGHLVIYVDSDTITLEEAAETVLGIRAEFDRANIPFQALDFCLQYPRPEEGPRPEGNIEFDNFPYDEICEEGLMERIEAADAELKAYYAQMDAMGK